MMLHSVLSQLAMIRLSIQFKYFIKLPSPLSVCSHKTQNDSTRAQQLYTFKILND